MTTPDRWWRGLDVAIVEALPSGARVLDIGCGGGGLVRHLSAAGLDAVGVDPRAPDAPRLVRSTVEELVAEAPFDAACAMMSLHHAALDPACEAISRLLRPGGRLFVTELSWERYDDRAAWWLDEHDGSGRSHSVAAWTEEHAELHTGPVIVAALERWFRRSEDEERPYLARMLGRHELEADERQRIASGSLPALGRYWTGTT